MLAHYEKKKKKQKTTRGPHCINKKKKNLKREPWSPLSWGEKKKILNLVGHTVHTVLSGPRVKYSSLLGSGTSQHTRAHQARVLSWVVWRPINPVTQWGTRAQWARVHCEVSEPTKLEYFTRTSNVWRKSNTFYKKKKKLKINNCPLT